MKGRRRKALALALGLALACAVSAAAGACSVTPRLEIPVRLVGPRAIVDVSIKGSSVPLIVDSGASSSVLTRAAAQRLGLELLPLQWGSRVLGATGEVEAERVRLDRIGLPRGEIRDVDFLIGGSDMDSGAVGLLGRNALGNADIEFDLARGVIRLLDVDDACRSPELAYWITKGDRAAVVLPLLADQRRLRFPAPQAMAGINDRELRVLFDTGAPSSIMTRSAARRVGITDAQLQPAGQTGGLGVARVEAWAALIDSLMLGSERLSGWRTRVADVDLRDDDLVLGMDFFMAHRIVISRLRERMVFTRNGDEAR